MNDTAKPEENKNIRWRILCLLASKNFRQLIRYGLVGIGINATLYACYLLLVFLDMEPKTAMSIVYAVGLGVGFYGHRNLTFPHTKNYRLAMARYLIAHIGGYAINFFLLVAFVDYMKLSHVLVQGLSILIVAAYLFVIFKHWVFLEKNYATN